MYFLTRDRLDKVTAADVQAAAGRYFRRDNRTVGVFLHDASPQRAELPAVVSATDALKDFQPKVVATSSEAFDPSPPNLDARTKHVDVDGFRLALLPKRNRGQVVSVSIRSPSGDEQSLFGQRTPLQLTSQMMMRGTSRHTRQQLQDEFTRLKIQGGVGDRGGSFETTRANVGAAIRLYAHVLREANFPTGEFDQLKRLAITSIESQMRDPGAVAANALAQHFNRYPKGDIRHAPSLKEQVDELQAASREQVVAFHDRFYGNRHLQIAVVGDYDEAEVVAAVRDAFAGWKKVDWTRVTSRYEAVPPLRTAIETPDKENAVLMARMPLDLNEDDADYPALFLVNYMFGGGAGMDARLMSRIRVKDGLSYGVGSSLNSGRFDRAAGWMAQAISAPQNSSKVEAAFQEELARMLKDGFGAEEIAKAKSGFQQKAVQARTQDSQLASQLLQDLDAGRSFAWDAAFEARVAALTPEQVTAAARKHLDPAKLSIVRAGDFRKAAAP